MGDPNRCGEVGESEYGLKADMIILFGEGSKGDFNAMIPDCMVGLCSCQERIASRDDDKALIGVAGGGGFVLACDAMQLRA